MFHIGCIGLTCWLLFSCSCVPILKSYSSLVKQRTHSNTARSDTCLSKQRIATPWDFSHGIHLQPFHFRIHLKYPFLSFLHSQRTQSQKVSVSQVSAYWHCTWSASNHAFAFLLLSSHSSSRASTRLPREEFSMCNTSLLAWEVVDMKSNVLAH